MKSEGKERVLAINPGSTSTKVAVFEGEGLLVDAVLPAPEHGTPEIWDQMAPRLEAIRDWLDGEGIPLWSLDAVVGRGGLLRPVKGGTYEVSEAMLSDARGNLQGVHASNLGCALARALADAGTFGRRLKEKNRPTAGGERAGTGEGDLEDTAAGPIPAFVVDPVSTDEFQPLARLSGMKEIPRRSLVHALSIHALVRDVCRGEGRTLEGSSFVAAHLGGGISVCPVRDGRILDGNNANSGGPFSPTRAGGVPTQDLLDLAFSGDYSRARLEALTLSEGGLVSYLGTDDALEVEARIASGDAEAALVYEAMAYQIAKEIGAMATVLNGKVDAILLTGGLAASALLTGWIRERVESIAPVVIVSGLEEMKALALGGLRVLKGDEEAKAYE